MSSPGFFLPREGFHADVLGGIIKRTLLNPFITVPVAVLGRYNEGGRKFVAEYLGPRSLKAATFLAIWGALRILNNLLDRRVLNNGIKDKYNWSREIVLITGGSDGIGKRIALMLASRNVKVVVLDIQPLTYEAPPTLLYVKTDITKPEALSTASRKVLDHFKSQPTVLILNAGVCRGKPILSATAADVALTFNVNTISHYTLMREFLPSLVKANHGMVVTVASTAAWVTAPRMTDYAASKAAALSFHEGLSTELVTVYSAPKVRTVLLNQGYTKTALFQGFGVKEGFVGPPLEVDTVAEAVVQQVLKGESAQIILPGVYKLMGAHWRSWSGWLQHSARIGMEDIMKDWDGRQVRGLEDVVDESKRS